MSAFYIGGVPTALHSVPQTYLYLLIKFTAIVSSLDLTSTLVQQKNCFSSTLQKLTKMAKQIL